MDFQRSVRDCHIKLRSDTIHILSLLFNSKTTFHKIGYLNAATSLALSVYKSCPWRELEGKRGMELGALNLKGGGGEASMLSHDCGIITYFPSKVQG